MIVHPSSQDYGRIEHRQMLGKVGGEIDPTLLTISKPVSYSDLDLSRDSDVNELRMRDTASDICGQPAASDIATAMTRI